MKASLAKYLPFWVLTAVAVQWRVKFSHAVKRFFYKHDYRHANASLCHFVQLAKTLPAFAEWLANGDYKPVIIRKNTAITPFICQSIQLLQKTPVR